MQGICVTGRIYERCLAQYWSCKLPALCLIYVLLRNVNHFQPARLCETLHIHRSVLFRLFFFFGWFIHDLDFEIVFELQYFIICKCIRCLFFVCSKSTTCPHILTFDFLTLGSISILFIWYTFITFI